MKLDLLSRNSLTEQVTNRIKQTLPPEIGKFLNGSNELMKSQELINKINQTYFLTSFIEFNLSKNYSRNFLRIDEKLEKFRTDFEILIETCKLHQMERVRCSTPSGHLTENSIPMMSHSLPVRLETESKIAVKKVSSKFQRISKKIKLKQFKLSKMKKSSERIFRNNKESNDENSLKSRNLKLVFKSEGNKKVSSSRGQLIEGFRSLDLNKTINLNDHTFMEKSCSGDLDETKVENDQHLLTNSMSQGETSETCDGDFSFFGIF